MDVAEHLNIQIDDDLLIRALRGRICPVCLVLQTKTYELLCRLQLEAVRDEMVNALILSAGGYCHFHFWYLEKLASPVTNARLMEKLLNGMNRSCLEMIPALRLVRVLSGQAAPFAIAVGNGKRAFCLALPAKYGGKLLPPNFKARPVFVCRICPRLLGQLPT